jgi:transposase InsO family protein
METAARRAPGHRPLRSCADAAWLATRDGACGGQQDPERLDIRHVYIRPRTPRLNGKVERSHRVDDQEFYQLLDQDGISDDNHLFNEKLREWEDYYNYHRPHGALDGQTPYERLPMKTRPEASPKP